MKLRNFNSYYLRAEENNSENSDNLNAASSEDFISIFSTQSIIDIYKYNKYNKYNFSPILTEENFNKKYSESQNFLSDLSNNSIFYYKDLKKKFIFFDEYYKMATNIYKFSYSKTSTIMYLYGPKGSSK